MNQSRAKGGLRQKNTPSSRSAYFSNAAPQAAPALPAVEVQGQQALDQREAADLGAQQETRPAVAGPAQHGDLLQRRRQQLHVHR